MDLILFFSIVGVVIACMFLYDKFFASAPTNIKPIPLDPAPKEPRVLQDFTLESLKQYTGENGTDIYISVLGKVYDVTPARGFYGPGAAYNCFAGKEASIALAKHSLDDKYTNQWDTSKLTWSEMDDLNGWIQRFEMKYEIAGYVKQIVDELKAAEEAKKAAAAAAKEDTTAEAASSSSSYDAKKTD
eukprot:GEZU01011232.1.p1 GENE.GEZU01011232.1~~GEZU01011232.1.p1  ORF type:complete len:203 (-),score=47.70 GEZU01011232.1:86-646(-)